MGRFQRRSAPELDVEVDVAAAARRAGAKAVIAGHLGRPSTRDRGLDPVHLLGRRGLVDEDPGRASQDRDPAKTITTATAIATAESIAAEPVT